MITILYQESRVTLYIAEQNEYLSVVRPMSDYSLLSHTSVPPFRELHEWEFVECRSHVAI